MQNAGFVHFWDLRFQTFYGEIAPDPIPVIIVLEDGITRGPELNFSLDTQIFSWATL
jgi:hypothetical protein